MIAMALFSGCLPPTGAQHQQGVDLVKALQKKPDLMTIIEADGFVFHGMYSAVIPPVVCLDIFTSGEIDTMAVVDIVQREMAILAIDKVNVRFYVGDLEQNRIYAQRKIRQDSGKAIKSSPQNQD